MQETFQEYKRNENIPEFPDQNEEDRQKELESVSATEDGEKQNLLLEQGH